MIRRTKKELIQIFKKLRESHAWSHKEAGELSIIRDRYEEGKEDEVHSLIDELDAKLGAKRRALFALWSDLTRSESARPKQRNTPRRASSRGSPFY